ncbi:MAG: phosphate ABC transporter substrate-binding protein [Syntrophomonadaceae bacterium]|nr:phosphate ABC transporter substrate-binding protein [Syntrophomonadaceae bacterium]
MISRQVVRKASFVLIGLLLLGAALVSGCGSKESAQTPAPALAGNLTIAGSTSVQPFSEVLAEQFMAQNKGVQISVQGGGSSVGIEAAVSGAANIGASSRALKDEEKNKGLVDTTIALDGIAIVVHPSNTVTNLKSEEVMNIYLGNIKNWKEVGGPDAPITIVSREEGSGTRDAFTDLVMKKKDIVKTAIIQNSTGAVRTTVAGDKNAIGYVSMASVTQEVRALSIDGVAANEANVKAGTYKIQRPFLYVTKGAPEGLAKAFIDFVLSAEGQKLIVEEGAFSISK